MGDAEHDVHRSDLTPIRTVARATRTVQLGARFAFWAEHPHIDALRAMDDNARAGVP